MPRKPKNPEPPPAPVPAERPDGTPLELEIRYRWHRGEEAIAVQVYRDAHPAEERPEISEAQEVCARIAAAGPPPEGYQLPGADQPEAPINGVVHPPDPAFQPTEHPERIEVVPATQNRYATLGIDEIDHTFSLTEEEALAMVHTAHTALVNLRAMKDAHAALRRQMRDDLAAAETEHARLSACADDRKETRKVKVKREADYVTGLVSYIIAEGPSVGTVLRTAPIADDDRQLRMFRERDRSVAVVSGLVAGLERPAKEPSEGGSSDDAEPEGDTDDANTDDEPSEDEGDWDADKPPDERGDF